MRTAEARLAPVSRGSDMGIGEGDGSNKVE